MTCDEVSWILECIEAKLGIHDAAEAEVEQAAQRLQLAKNPSQQLREMVLG